MPSGVSGESQSGPISLADEESVRKLLVNTVFNLWDVVNDLSRLRPTRRDHYRVTIFGSARTQPGTFGYEEVKRLAASLAEMGCDIITGGGPGMMQAANEGASAVNCPERSRSVGIRVELPFEQTVNPFVAEAYEHKTFFSRLHHFVLASDAFIVTPGGIGTVLELMMIWQLLQVKHVQAVPLILVGKMWPGLIEWARVSLLSTQPPLANAEDLTVPRCVETADAAIALIRHEQEVWLKSASN